MRYLLILFSVFALQTAWGEAVLKIVDQDNQPVSNAIVSLPSTPVVTPATVAIMDQIHIAFEPHVLIVQKGQSVSFPNSDNIRHHVYSFSKPKAFEIKLYKGSNIPPIRFDKPGLVILGCNIHDSMIGYIYVADNVYTVKTDENGIAKLPAKKGDQVILWSERFIEGVHTMKTFSVSGDAEQIIKLDFLPPIKSMKMDYEDY